MIVTSKFYNENLKKIRAPTMAVRECVYVWDENEEMSRYEITKLSHTNWTGRYDFLEKSHTELMSMAFSNIQYDI